MADSHRREKTVTVTDNSTGKSVTLPVNSGTIGPDVIDIRKLYAETGMFTFDPGYGATGSCVSGFTYIDGEEVFYCIVGMQLKILPVTPIFSRLPICYSTVTYQL